jgi:large subunit ribosomal protein L19
MDVSSLIDVKPNTKIPSLSPGDTVRVRVKVIEGDKERIQVFQGVVIKEGGRGTGASFTVRRVTYGVGVERTFPLYSPIIDAVEVVRHGKVRRARLYYLRGLSAKQSRIKERRVLIGKEELALVPEAEVPEAEVPSPVAEVPLATETPVAAAPTPAEAKAEAPPTEAPPEAEAAPHAQEQKQS